MLIDKIKEISQCKYVSFDIFDTLIKRNVNVATDIFDIVEQRLDCKLIKNYKKNRICAEKKCRKKIKGEITLKDIYKELTRFYTEEICMKLMCLESQIELEYTQANNDNEINNVYKWACSNKKVVLISDMYLDEKIIKKILSKNNIKYDQLFISCKYGKTKNKGDLYDFVLEKLNLKKDEIIHIGDNYISDYKVPKNKGIVSFYYNNKNLKEKHISLNSNILNTFIKNNIRDDYNYYKTFGYKNLGPILNFFSLWLIESLKNKKISKVFFLSRDGLILKKAFDIINDDKMIKSTYLYGSRRALIVPSIYKKKNNDEIISSMTILKDFKIENFIKKIGLDFNDVNSEISRLNIDLDKKFSLNKIQDKKIIYEFMDSIKDKIILNSYSENVSLNNFYKKFDFSQKVAIVDIGWYGTMQLALSELFPEVDIEGYYIGLNSNNKNEELLNMYGFLFDKKNNIEFSKIINSFVAIFELIFTATHGSVKRFDGDNVEFYDYEFEGRLENQVIKDIQKGALDFVKDYKKVGLNIEKIDILTILSNIVNFSTNPTNYDVDKFKDIYFLDNEFKSIINFDENINYFMNLKKAYLDFKNSNWKVGFMKMLFKINLPYYKIYSLLKK